MPYELPCTRCAKVNRIPDGTRQALCGACRTPLLAFEDDGTPIPPVAPERPNWTSLSGFAEYIISQHRPPRIFKYLRSLRIHREAVRVYDQTMVRVQKAKAEERLRIAENERQQRLQLELEARRQRELAEREAQARAHWAEMHRHIAFESLDTLSGHEFEQTLARMFCHLGYAVTEMKETGDQGADLIIEQNSRRLAVQAKRYTGRVGNGAVQELLGAIAFYGCEGGVVITTADFTKSARRLAAKVPQVQLWPRRKLCEVYCRAFPDEIPEFSWEKYNSMRASNERRRDFWSSPKLRANWNRNGTSV